MNERDKVGRNRAGLNPTENSPEVVKYINQQIKETVEQINAEIDEMADPLIEPAELGKREYALLLECFSIGSMLHRMIEKSPASMYDEVLSWIVEFGLAEKTINKKWVKVIDGTLSMSEAYEKRIVTLFERFATFLETEKDWQPNEK